MIAALYCTVNAENVVEYRNPISPWSVDAWDDYGFGDPFIMRYNGRYYLYPSTRDDSIGVKCWSSLDLVNWRYEGLCTTEPTTKGAYAPEVFHANDAFYMISSPAGRGHYIYRSLSPTGPFERSTENFGLSIDGTAFIDDDGQGYFYSSSDKGILAYKMKSPTEVTPVPVNVGASMQGWTEGPGVIKHDGVYYITYTGNHVFSRGYRIDGGAGDSPLKFSESRNPILISTEGEIYGIGHNSIVKGPGLDLYYVAYHTLIGHGKRIGWPVRETNIDLLTLNGERLEIVGPTRGKRKLLMPDSAAWFEDENALKNINFYASGGAKLSVLSEEGVAKLPNGSEIELKETIPGDFTAEFNLAIASSDGVAGIFFCRENAENWGRFTIDRGAKTITISLVVDGKEETKTIEFPKLFGEPISFATPQSIQIEREGDRFRFFIEDRFCFETTFPAKHGTIGYYAENTDAFCGFVGVTKTTRGRSARRLAVPAPGRFSTSAFATRNGAEAFETVDDGKRIYAITLQDNDALNVELDAAAEGKYRAVVRYAAEDSGTLELAIDGKKVQEKLFGKNIVDENERFGVLVVDDLALKTGNNRLTMICAQGTITIASAELTLCDNEGPNNTVLDVDSPRYSDGQWNIESGALACVGERYGKRFYGENAWGDYRVDAEVVFASENGGAGVVLRATHPALGGPNNSPKLGKDFFFGYYVGLRGGKVVLERRRYNAIEVLAEKSVTTARGEPTTLSAAVEGNKTTVWVDGKKALSVVDRDPLPTGRWGVRAEGGEARFNSLRVQSIE